MSSHTARLLFAAGVKGGNFETDGRGVTVQDDWNRSVIT